MCFSIFKHVTKNKPAAVSAPELVTNTTKSSDVRGGSRSFPSTRSIPELFKEKENDLRVFSYKELSDATCGFHRSLEIGRGGFGTVYRGKISFASKPIRTVEVAVKTLNKNGFQGHIEWITEVQFLGVVSHPNLVKLLGYCHEDDERGIQRLLVYELMPNRSLEDHLFGKNYPTLPWKARLQIILDAAEGLAYLHHGMEIQVIFRDFKCSNILLDKDMKGKLSDFGMAREGPRGDETHVSTRRVGTYGYAAPEYIETGHLKAESDIWSLGVVLYEVLSGRRAFDGNRPSNEQKLVVWAQKYPVDSNMFCMLMDPRLKKNYSMKSARRIGKLAEECLSKNPKDRPSMVQVVDSIKEAIRECL